MLQQYEKSSEYEENYPHNIGKRFEYIRLLAQKLLLKFFLVTNCKNLGFIYIHFLTSGLINLITTPPLLGYFS